MKICLRKYKFIADNKIAVLYKGQLWFVDMIDTENTESIWITSCPITHECGTSLIVPIDSLVYDELTFYYTNIVFQHLHQEQMDEILNILYLIERINK